MSSLQLLITARWEPASFHCLSWVSSTTVYSADGLCRLTTMMKCLHVKYGSMVLPFADVFTKAVFLSLLTQRVARNETLITTIKSLAYSSQCKGFNHVVFHFGFRTRSYQVRLPMFSWLTFPTKACSVEWCACWCERSTKCWTTFQSGWLDCVTWVSGWNIGYCECSTKFLPFTTCREPGQEHSPVKVGFVTYNKRLHFYNIKVMSACSRFQTLLQDSTWISHLLILCYSSCVYNLEKDLNYGGIEYGKGLEKSLKSSFIFCTSGLRASQIDYSTNYGLTELFKYWFGMNGVFAANN